MWNLRAYDRASDELSCEVGLPGIEVESIVKVAPWLATPVDRKTLWYLLTLANAQTKMNKEFEWFLEFDAKPVK